MTQRTKAPLHLVDVRASDWNEYFCATCACGSPASR